MHACLTRATVVWLKRACQFLLRQRLGNASKCADQLEDVARGAWFCFLPPGNQLIPEFCRELLVTQPCSIANDEVIKLLVR